MIFININKNLKDLQKYILENDFKTLDQRFIGFSKEGLESKLKQFDICFQRLDEYKKIFEYFYIERCFECNSILENIRDTLISKNEQTLSSCEKLLNITIEKIKTVEQSSIDLLLYFLVKESALFYAYNKEEIINQLKISKKNRIKNKKG